jgi:hypothetical protein
VGEAAGKYVLQRSTYQACMARRTHASILNGKKIGGEIPPCAQRLDVHDVN